MNTDHEFPEDLRDLDRASVARMVGTDLAVVQQFGPPPDLAATMASFAALVRGAA